MGRTQHTYRMRLRSARDRMKKLQKQLDPDRIELYDQLWKYSHHLSGPASMFPWPDTRTIATYTIILEFMKQLKGLEDQITVLRMKGDSGES